LPGTRREVAAIGRLFPAAKLLLGGEASREHLQTLASNGDLKHYRYLHFATHAISDPARQLQSALICSRPANSASTQGSPETQPDDAARITAEQILQTWKLNADLVTLSACETALGKYTAAEGHVGFTQALLLAGARSLLLSLWKVDDSATTLLMVRFYENLLGKRPGESHRLPKAEALREAKEWLRNLTAQEAAKLVSGLNAGVRGAEELRVPATADTSIRPYAHPYFWSAFILVGDPK
jgi:CHAT domain-containing protein